MRKPEIERQLHAAALDVGSIDNRNLPEMEQWDDDASQVTVATKNSSDRSRPKTKRTHKNKNKKKQKPKKKYGKQAAGSSKANGSSKRTHEENQPRPGSNFGANGNTENTNSNKRQKDDMNDKSSRFNDELCLGKLGGKDDTTDVDELQSFSINFSFRDVP